MTLQSWFSWNTSIKRGHKVCRVYVFVHICMCMWVCFYLYKYIYICVYMYMSIYVSGFPNWDIVVRGQTYRRERQVYLYTCHGFVGWITNFVTTSAYVKRINGFKIIWRYLPSKYKDIIRKIYFTVDYLKEYVIWHFTFRKKDQVGEHLPSLVLLFWAKFCIFNFI